MKNHGLNLNTMTGALTDVKMQMQSLFTVAAQQRVMRNFAKVPSLTT